MFAAEGVPVYDADAEVHTLYTSGGAAISAIETAFPGVVKGGAVDRVDLSDRVFRDPAELKMLEAIIHPHIQDSRRRFFAKAEKNKAHLVLLEIPLLFETGGESSFDAVVVVSAPEAIQRERVLGRPNMTADKLDAILARQMRDEEKRAKAHFVIDTGGSIQSVRDQVRLIIESLTMTDWVGRKAALENNRKTPQG